MMKRSLVGGPLLGEKPGSSPPSGRKRFQPLITPLITASSLSASNKTTKKGEQFILLPQSRFIQVLAFETGNPVANLIPFGNSATSTSETRIESVCLATYPAKPRNAFDILEQLSQTAKADDKNEKQKNKGANRREENVNVVDHVVLVGCSDGSLCEFSLISLLATSFGSNNNEHLLLKDDDNSCGPWSLDGPCYGPRRVFRLSQQHQLSVMHLAAPACVARTDYGLLVYALTQTQAQKQNPNPTKTNKIDSKRKRVSLLRLLLPPYYDDTIMKRKVQVDLWNEGGQHGESDNSDTNNSFSRIKKIDKINCKGELREDGSIAFDTAPFRLEAVVRDRSQSLLLNAPALREQVIYLVVARPTIVQVFCERLSDIGLVSSGGKEEVKRLPPVSFDMSSHLCSIAVSSNKSDIACGFAQGHIVAHSNLLAHVEEYHLALERYQNQTSNNNNTIEKSTGASVQQPEHPARKIVKSQVHWHAHPVTTLCYDPNSSPTDPILYSGGEESVLVTWQLSRGAHRPSDLLPRIAWRGIQHIVCNKRVDRAPNTNDSILVFCEDNTLQLFESHSKALLWKLRGLAVLPTEKSSAKAGTLLPTIAKDPKGTLGSAASQLVLYGLPDAPGLLQWYDTKQQRVVGHLEIAPFNRISGIDRKSKSLMPEPVVSNMAQSITANDLITIDNVPTENEYVGATNGEFGVVPTVKFWAWAAAAQSIPQKSDVTSKPYQLVAAMAHPHGTGNLVNAATMASNGLYACTVSNDEKAFRIWNKMAADRDHDGDEPGARRLPVWICHCKVTIPSGFSNHTTGDRAVAFSSDGSILAICFGHMITIWDRANVTLLTCLRHLGGEDAIDAVEFVKNDMIMCKSSMGVSVQSLFQTADLAELNWGWTVKGLDPPAAVSCAHYLAAHDKVAISVFCAEEDSSRIVLMNVMYTDPAILNNEGGVVVENLPGSVLSLGESGAATTMSNWRDEDSTVTDLEPTSLSLFGLNNKGQMFVLETAGGSMEGRTIGSSKTSSNSGPVKDLPTLPTRQGSSSSEQPRKRRRDAAMNSIIYDDAGQAPNKKLLVSNYGSMLDENGTAVPLETSELPALSGGFTRAFIGRHLSKPNPESYC